MVKFDAGIISVSTVKSQLMDERKSVKEVKISISKEEVEKLVDEVAIRIKIYYRS